MTVAPPAFGFHTVGQEVARTIAQRAARAGRLQRTILVYGPAGAGKGAFVDDLLALIFCQAPDAAGRPCNVCRGCRDARARAHPDLLIGSPTAWRESRTTGESIVAAARRWLLGTATSPIAGEIRVVLIEGVDQANEAIQNAMLKALEEPAPRQMFILVAQEVASLLPTIRSRATPLRVGPIGMVQLRELLMDRERLPADQAEALARISDGLTGRAIGYARNPSLLEGRRRTQAELLHLLGRGRADRFASARELLDAAAALGAAPVETVDSVADEEPVRLAGAAQRAAAMLIVEAWRALARDLLIVRSGRPELAGSSQAVELAKAAESLRDEGLVAFINLLERTAEGLRANAAPRLALERAMLAWPLTSGTS
jgi:DNA polymerase III delta prime subunit